MHRRKRNTRIVGDITQEGIENLEEEIMGVLVGV